MKSEVKMVNLAHPKDQQNEFSIGEENNEEFLEPNPNIAETQLVDKTYGVTEEELEDPNFWINL